MGVQDAVPVCIVRPTLLGTSGVDGCVSACVNCTTCSQLRVLLFVTRLVFVMYYLRVFGTSPRQIPMYILIPLELPSVLVSMYRFHSQ